MKLASYYGTQVDRRMTETTSEAQKLKYSHPNT